MIEFEGDIEFNGDVHPACVRIDASDVPEDTELTIAGWGTIEADRMYTFEIFKIFMSAENLNIQKILENNFLLHAHRNESIENFAESQFEYCSARQLQSNIGQIQWITESAQFTWAQQFTNVRAQSSNKVGCMSRW